MSNPIPPHAPSDVSTMFALWVAARAQTGTARLRGEPGHPDAYWTELRLATEISRAVLTDRWCTVARLLQAGAIESWTQVSRACGLIPETTLRLGFLEWLDHQWGAFRHPDSISLSDTEAQDLRALAHQVPL